MNNFEIAKILSPIIRESLFEIESVKNIVPNDSRDDFSFEIEGIAQSANKFSTDIELAREMAKYFEVSFEGNFIAADFLKTARIILEELKKIGAKVE